MFSKRKKEKEIEVREDGLADYNQYVMSQKEKLFYVIIAMAVLFVIGYIFYHNIILSGILMILGVKFPALRTKQIIAKRKKQLTIQFKDMLYSLSSALSVGKSVEMGLRDCLKDLEIIYPDSFTGNKHIHKIFNIFYMGSVRKQAKAM